MRLFLCLTIICAMQLAEGFLPSKPLFPSRLLDDKRKSPAVSGATQPNNQGDLNDGKRLPSLIIFDLDGCLWRPEMYELLYFSGGAGAPFTKSPDYDNDGTLLTRAGEPVRLLGQVGQVMQDLYCDTTKWQKTLVGISSRTDQPDWARELLRKFTIQVSTSEETTSHDNSSTNAFALKDVFQGPIVIGSDSKVKHFQSISAETGIAMEDILFFDNERGNCVEVAKLGVVVAYCPDGVTKRIWDISLEAFPTASGKVVGLDIYSYDTLDGAKLFYDGDDYKRTQW